jgi:hypothetical protein
VVFDPDEPPESGSPMCPEHSFIAPGFPLGTLRDTASATLSRIQPVAPGGEVQGGETNARISLPGPTLPIELTSLGGAGISAPIAPRAKAPLGSGIPSWVVSVLVALTLMAAALSLTFYLMPGALGGSAPVSAPVDEAKAAPAVPAVAAPVPSAHPLAKHVEVTGFRFVTEPGRAPAIHYIVVNHSAARISDITVNVTLRPVGGLATQPVLSRFSFPMPALGAYESKEMVSPIERVTRPGTLPEWQNLAVQVDIAQ